MAAADFTPTAIPLAPSQTLQTRLQTLSKARQKQILFRSLVRGLLPAFGVSALGVALYKLHIIPDAPLWLPAIPVTLGVLWALRQTKLQSRGDFVAALETDAKLGQNDRLSSALAFINPEKTGRYETVDVPKTPLEKLRRAIFGATPVLNHSVSSPATNLVPALVEEAANRAQKLEPSRVYPLQFDRRAQLLAALAITFAGLCFAPDYPILLSEKEKKERAAMMKEGEKLVALSKTVRKNPAVPPPAEIEQLNKRLQKLGQKMARGRLTKRAALTDIGELKKQLQKAQTPKGQSQAQSGGLPQIPEAVKQAPLQSKVGREVQKDLLDGRAEEAAKKLEALADKLDKGQLTQKEKNDAAKDLEQVAKALRERGGKANENAAKQLEEAAKALRQPENQSGQNNPQQNGQQQNGQQSQNGQQNSPDKQNQQNQGQQQQNGQGQQQPQQNGQGKEQQSGQGQQPQPQGQGQNQNQGGSQQQQQQGGDKPSQNQAGQSQGQQPQGQQGQGQQGSQGQQNGEGQQGQGQAGSALRDMANGLRQQSGGSGSGNLGEMLDKLREAENGTNGGSQFGMGKPTDVTPKFGGDCPGGDCRGLVTPGKDLKATSGRGNNTGGAGLGPRDQSTGNKGGGGVSNMKSRRTGDQRRYQDVWSDRLPATRKKLDKINGKWGGSGEVEQMPTRGEGKGGEASTPYYDVYESYKKDAEDAVGRESVPPAYKENVKEYFESIKP